jgi:hypothetical protein
MATSRPSDADELDTEHPAPDEEESEAIRALVRLRREYVVWASVGVILGITAVVLVATVGRGAIANLLPTLSGNTQTVVLSGLLIALGIPSLLTSIFVYRRLYDSYMRRALARQLEEHANVFRDIERDIHQSLQKRM